MRTITRAVGTLFATATLGFALVPAAGAGAAATSAAAVLPAIVAVPANPATCARNNADGAAKGQATEKAISDGAAKGQATEKTCRINYNPSKSNTANV